jgi:outer membrane protein insertion porin family
MRRAAIWAISLCVPLAAISADVDGPDAVVREVVVKNLGPGPLDQGFVMAHTLIRPGMKLERAAVSRDLKGLLATERFSSAEVGYEPVADGVRIVYRIRNKYRLVEPVKAEGMQHWFFPARKLRETLKLDKGDLVDEPTLAVGVQKLREEYIKDHYLNVVISYAIEPTDEQEGLARVRLAVAEDGRAWITHLRFEGNEHAKALAIRDAIVRPPPWDLLGLLRKRPYTDDEFETDRLGIRDFYQDKAYLDVEVDPARIGTDKHGHRTVTFTVHEGICYRFGAFALDGITKFPQAELNKQVLIKTGALGSAATIRKTVQNIHDFYGSRGYVKVQVRPALTPDPAKATVDVRITVEEGERVRIGNIRIRGNTRTRDRVIRRELTVYPGDIMDDVKARTSERKLANLGFFSDVRRYPLETAVSDRQDLVYEVEEKRTGQFMIGAGFSSVDNLIGFAELSQGNFDLFGWPYFTGGGQKLRLRTQFGSTREDYELSFVEPWFLNRQLSLGVDLYLSNIDYSDYDIRRTGGALTLGKALPWANRISLRYALERLEETDATDTNQWRYAEAPYDKYTFVQDLDYLDSSLRLTLSHDTRNDPFIPSRGTLASAFASVSAGWLGSDIEIYGLGAKASWYVPLWFRHVLAFKLRYELVDEFGNTAEMPMSERLFIGGGHTIRGFDYRDVGPKAVPVDAGPDNRTYRAVGGRSLALANVEYTVPIVRGIRLGGFYDIGKVWRDPYAFDTQTLAAGAGVGLRLDVPGFPIRIDRAWVMQRDDDLTQEDEWVFWIGYDY